MKAILKAFIGQTLKIFPKEFKIRENGLNPVGFPVIIEIFCYLSPKTKDSCRTQTIGGTPPEGRFVSDF